MICLVLSSAAENRLNELGDSYEESTGQVWNPAMFIEGMVLNADLGNLLELISNE